MARIREEIQIIENKVAGQQMIVRPAIGRTWLEWHIEHDGITLAQLTNIRIVLVSRDKTVVLQEFKNGVELDEINQRYGRHTAAGTLSLYMRRPEMESEIARMATALGTGGLQAIRLEMDIDAGAVFTSSNVKAWGKKSANRNVAAGLLTYFSNTNRGGAAAGDNHWDNLNIRDRLAALHVLNDKVSDVELRIDDATAHKLSIARNNYDELAAYRVPYATNYGYCIDFVASGSLEEALILKDSNSGYQVNETRVTVTLAASPAATIRYLAEYLSSWNSLVGAN